MDFRIADTFTNSLAKLTGEEQKSRQHHGQDGVMSETQEFLIHQSEDGSARIDLMLEAETLWLNQKQFTELFGKAKWKVSEHLKPTFEDGEFKESSVVRFFRTTLADGKHRTSSLSRLN